MVKREVMFNAILHHVNTLQTKEQMKAIARWLQTYADYYNDLVGVQILVTQLYLQGMRIERGAMEQQIVQLQHDNNSLRNHIDRFSKN